MKRWLFYIALAWHDISRLWRITQHQVIIVTGICLPVLLLLGLKRGHVAELRHDLITSPTGRQIIFWSAQRGKLLNREVLQQLHSKLLNIDVIVPESQRLVRLDSLSKSQTDDGAQSDLGHVDSTTNDSLITFYSTAEGDPILRQFSADVLQSAEKAVVLTTGAARHVGVGVGDHALLTAFRRRDKVDESHSFSVLIKAIVPSHDNSTLSGYANVSLLAQLEQYTRGYAVPELNLPAMYGVMPPDEYESYLLFCQKAPESDLTGEDKAFLLERGIHCIEVNDPKVKGLYGLLKTNRLKEIKVYQLTQGIEENGSQQTLKISPLFITENMKAIDVFVLRWNPATDLPVDGRPMRIVGLSLPTQSQSGGWIRDYLCQPDRGFDFETSLHNPLQIQLIGDREEATNHIAHVQVTSDQVIPFSIVRLPPPRLWRQTDTAAIPQSTTAQLSDLEQSNRSQSRPDRNVGEEEVSNKNPAQKAKAGTDVTKDNDTQPPIQNTAAAPTSALAIMPANSLAWLRGMTSGKLAFDPQSCVFTAQPEPIVFDKARLYTATIDDVPTVVDQLSSEGYAVLSESNHIAEIQTQDRSLQALVVVVGLGVFIFGTITVIGVLIDATERKRGTIGILRVMGMSRTGIFFVVVQRAIIVGIFAAALSICLGAGLAWVLTEVGGQTFSFARLSIPAITIPRISIVFHREDYFAIGLGALFCSGLGAVVPAWRASAIDPFDAIVEGKFH